MTSRIAPLGLVLLTLVLVLSSIPAGATPPAISIVHTPPTSTLPGLQINLTAVLTNATAASVRWNNGSMANDSVAPLTNTSVRSGDGWVYSGWLPAQQDGVQVSYMINATNGPEIHLESYFLTVSVPASSGLTAADQEQWILTLAASLSMAISTAAVLYWYIGRRLRREGK